MEKAGSRSSSIKPSALASTRRSPIKCPLHCVFCYNPVDYAHSGAELTTEEWLRVLRQARELGAMQLGISGGEPLMRDDLEIMVAEAHKLGYYTQSADFGRRARPKSASPPSRKAAWTRSSCRSRIPRAR